MKILVKLFVNFSYNSLRSEKRVWLRNFAWDDFVFANDGIQLLHILVSLGVGHDTNFAEV